PQLPRAEWEVRNGYDTQRLNLRRQIEASLAAYMLEANKIGGDVLEVGRAISALSDPRARLALPQDEHDAKLSSDSWQYWYRAKLNDDIKAFLAQTSHVELSVREGSSKTDRFEERWNASASVGWFGLFEANGAASGETIRRHAEEQSQSVSISFENMQSF